MQTNTFRRWLWVAAGFLGAWLFISHLLPLLFPFGLGLLLALAAEPAVKAGTRLLKMPRWAAAGVGVSLTMLLLITLVGILGAALVKELGVLAKRLPDLQEAAQQSVDTLRVFVEDAANRAPEGVRPLVDRSVDRLFSSGDALMEQVAGQLPGALSSFLGKIPDGALTVGTGILSGFMLSARLPKLKKALLEKLPEKIRTGFLPALHRVKTAIFGWLKAQLKLTAITFGILLVGFLLLKISNAPLWAGIVAVVDAVPILGTGTVLLPWALVSLLQGEQLRAIGLLCVYGVTYLTRTVLEPRLVGRSLGVDPLLTLLFLYIGYRFWGILGLIFTPMLAAAILNATRAAKTVDTKKGPLA